MKSLQEIPQILKEDLKLLLEAGPRTVTELHSFLAGRYTYEQVVRALAEMTLSKDLVAEDFNSVYAINRARFSVRA